MTVQLTPSLQVTTVHPLSQGGVPVLVTDGESRVAFDQVEAFAPADLIEVLGHKAPAAYWAYFYGKDLTGAERQLVAGYLRQWREGPQLDP